MDRELPAGEGLVAAAGSARAAESGATLRTDTAPGRREMNIAVLKTKAEQSLAEGFASVAAELPGGAAGPPGAHRCTYAGSGRWGCRIGASKRGSTPTCAT